MFLIIAEIESNLVIESFRKKDSHWGEILGLYIYTNRDIDSDEIKRKLKEKLSTYKIPKLIVIKKPL